MLSIYDLVARVRGSKSSTVDYTISGVVSWARHKGVLVNPVGAANEKTELPSTYRPVGATCPSTCPFLENGCYAQQGRVGPIERRATAGVSESLNAAAIGMAAAMKFGTVCRLHVSGDFLRPDGQVDTEYILGLSALAAGLRGEPGSDPGAIVAYGYTHIPPEAFEPWRRLLERSGIVVLYSDYLGPGGAVVVSHDKVPELRASSGLTIAKCPAQLSDRVSCRTCKVCWEKSWQRGIVVAFDPHGPAHRRAASASPHEIGV